MLPFFSPQFPDSKLPPSSGRGGETPLLPSLQERFLSPPDNGGTEGGAKTIEEPKGGCKDH